MAAIALVAAAPATAASIAVTRFADAVANDGRCTLREAITAANADAPSGDRPGECAAGSGADTITAPSGTYALTRAGADEDANATGDLDITSDVTLQGAGASTTIIDAQQLDRVVDVRGGFVVFSGLAITGGLTPAGAEGQNSGAPGAVSPTNGEPGGGIRNAGTLRVLDSTITRNATGSGGSVHVAAGVTPDRVLWNASGGWGGGIATHASLRVVRTAINHNRTGEGGGPGTGDKPFDAYGGSGGSGAGLDNDHGSVEIVASAINDNKTGNGGRASYGPLGTPDIPGEGGCGGGIRSWGPLRIENATITANATGDAPADDDWTCAGGGIWAVGRVRLNEVTLAHDRNGTMGSCGCDRPSHNEVVVDAHTDVLAQNTLIVSTLADQFGMFPLVVCGGGNLVDGGHNLSYTPSATGCPGTTSVDPRLGPLVPNGGPTRTMALAPGSAAVDAVPAIGAACTKADQRGVQRPQGAACDIGAYELAPS